MSILEVALVPRRVIKHAKINGVHRTELPEYRIYTGMIARCGNPNSSGYYRYGGRGIKVCDRWLEDFKNFYDDMGPRPSPKHSIDRIDNDGNYEPGNCRWATNAEQVANKSRPKEPSRENPYYWSAEDDETVRRMYLRYYPTEQIAAVIGRTYGTTRLRVFKLGLRRDQSYSKLLKKHRDLAPVMHELGPDAFLTALKNKVSAEKAAKLREKQNKATLHSEVVARILAGQDDRNSKMRALRLAGCDLAEIGRLFGITRERVRQIQLTDFKAHNEADRKVSSTRPENRARHVDRLAMAWNKASVEARLLFLEQAAVDPRAKLPRLLKAKRQTRQMARAA